MFITIEQEEAEPYISYQRKAYLCTYNITLALGTLTLGSLH